MYIYLTNQPNTYIERYDSNGNILEKKTVVVVTVKSWLEGFTDDSSVFLPKYGGYILYISTNEEIKTDRAIFLDEIPTEVEQELNFIIDENFNTIK